MELSVRITARQMFLIVLLIGAMIIVNNALSQGTPPARWEQGPSGRPGPIYSHQAAAWV